MHCLRLFLTSCIFSLHISIIYYLSLCVSVSLPFLSHNFICSLSSRNYLHSFAAPHTLFHQINLWTCIFNYIHMDRIQQQKRIPFFYLSIQHIYAVALVYSLIKWSWTFLFAILTISLITLWFWVH